MKAELRFSFVEQESGNGAIPIRWDAPYDPAAGYGFAETAAPTRNEEMRDFWPGDYFIPRIKTFLADVPYGNYEVTVVFGREDMPTETSVKAGPGRLMLKQVRAEAGQTVAEGFAVHVDDGRLKLAFSGSLPSVKMLELKRVPLMPTLFLAGDSTVTDQPSGQFPYAGWGQMIGVCFNSGIAVSNHARSGRSSKSFIDEGRLNRLWKHVKPSDYLFVQFAHNDEKDNEGGTKPFTTYQEYLQEYIAGARERGAFPVLVSPMHRRFFDENGHICNTHGEYIEAMRQLAEREHVPYLDLAAKSKLYFQELGPERTKDVFLWAEPGQYPHFPEGAKDNTHFTEMGGAAIAGLVAECIREAGIAPLIGFLR